MNKKNTEKIIGIREITKKNLCDGKLFLNVGGKNIFLMSSGTFIDDEFIKKHAALNSKFVLEQEINHEIKSEFKRLFKELKYTQFEKDLRLKCLEIIDAFYRIYREENHFISFALAAYEEFCLLPRHEQSSLHEADVNLFRKSLYSAAFSVLISIANDFYHYLVLRDLYNVTFSLDLGLGGENYTYYISEACNRESRFPGEGIRYLEQENVSKAEKELYLQHPRVGSEKLSSLNILSYPKLSQIILFQHELSSGEGFPDGIKKGQISIWDSIAILADSLVEISSEHEFEKNVINYFYSLEESKTHDLPVSKVLKNLMRVFGHLNVQVAG